MWYSLVSSQLVVFRLLLPPPPTMKMALDRLRPGCGLASFEYNYHRPSCCCWCKGEQERCCWSNNRRMNLNIDWLKVQENCLRRHSRIGEQGWASIDTLVKEHRHRSWLQVVLKPILPEETKSRRKPSPSVAVFLSQTISQTKRNWWLSPLTCIEGMLFNQIN